VTGPRSCPACLSTDSRAAGRAGAFELRRCRGCGSLFTARLPRPGEDEPYADYYHDGNLTVPAFITGRLDELVVSFEGSRRTNAWLDVGCGAGALMRAARERGWEAAGTEVSERPAQLLREEGFDVRVGELAGVGFPEAAFDVVSMVEVLEHVSNPATLLSHAQRHLRPGGLLYVTTPHGRGISARLLGTGWSVVSPPEHLQLFSRRGLRSAVERAGLVVVSLATHAVNPIEIVRRLRPGGSDLSGGERVESAYRLNESMSSGRGGRTIKRVANRALDLARMGDSLKLVARRSA
jgi:SAM-dependent methyltransferase